MKKLQFYNTNDPHEPRIAVSTCAHDFVMLKLSTDLKSNMMQATLELKDIKRLIYQLQSWIEKKEIS